MVDPGFERVRQARPDLEIRSIRLGEDSLVNDVFIVNEEWVFRFSKSAAGEKRLEREIAILGRIRDRVSLRVPRVEFSGTGWMAYRLISGIPLSRHALVALQAEVRARVFDQLGGFLSELNATFLPDLHPISRVEQRAKTTRLFEALQTELFPFMMAHARAWAVDLFQPVLDGSLDLAYSPVLIHGDLVPYHLCFDPATAQLSGVIDFGDAGPGDPAFDVASLLLAFGESLVRLLTPAYPILDSCMERARFYAGSLELRWALQAVRSRDPAWFLCHLGYARDLAPVFKPSSSLPSP